MGPPQAQHPRPKLHCHAAQLSGRRPSHAAAQASSPVLLSQASPFAHRPHRAAQAGCNRGVFHSRAGEFFDHDTFLKRRLLSLMVHDIFSSCLHSFPLRYHIPSIHSLQAVRLGETREGYDFSRLNTRPERVTIVFRANNEQREATVLTSCWRSEHAEDVAILQLIGNLPAGVTPLPLGSTAGTDGHHVQTFGFPHVGDIMGVWGRGTVLGIVTEAQLRLIQLSSSEITEGFSGAPVWDESRGRVIGQVVKIATPDRNLRLAATVFATPTETLRAVCPLLSFSEECPYRNLDAFTEADAKFFFGRERVVEELVGSLVAEPRFLAVFGPSGSGKSSVVQAALIPRLRRGDVPDSDRWEIIVTRPSDHSFAHLVTNVQQAHRHTLLIIDQFEELFVTSIEAVRQDIIASLTQLLEHSPRTSIVFVLRDDFYSHFVQHERLAQWLKRGLVNVSSWLTRNELMAIVREPARVMGLSFETGLVEKIVEDTVETGKRSETGYSPTGRSAVLPLLEFTLTQ